MSLHVGSNPRVANIPASSGARVAQSPADSLTGTESKAFGASDRDELREHTATSLSEEERDALADNLTRFLISSYKGEISKRAVMNFADTYLSDKAMRKISRASFYFRAVPGLGFVVSIGLAFFVPFLAFPLFFVSCVVGIYFLFSKNRKMQFSE